MSIIPRTRSRGSLVVGGQTLQMTDWPNPCPNTTRVNAPLVFGSAALGEKKIISDWVNIGFRKRVKKGEFVFSPLFIDTLNYRCVGNSTVTFTQKTTTCTPPVHYWFRQVGKYFYYKLMSFENPGLTTVLVPNEINDLADGVWTASRAGVQQGSANFVESLAELDKAFLMLANPLENVNRFIKDFRKSAKRRNTYLRVASESRDLIRFLSSEWLRFRYGISPMVSDIQAAMATLQKRFDMKPVVHRSRSNGTISRYKVDSHDASASEAPNATFKWQKVMQDNCSCRASSYDKYAVSPFDTLGLTLQNVLGVWWELTHYSFVVDWFANVGDLIYANLPRVNSSHLGGVVTTQQYTVTTYNATQFTELPGGAWNIDGTLTDILIFERRRTIRTPRTDNGSLVVKSDFRFDHWKRAADAAALSTQLLRSIRF